jgi:NAD(P)-dependent dehydrogenase (short-subunit alcohol dehydrogenase family)
VFSNGIAAALPVFRKQGFGHFVNTASTAGLGGRSDSELSMRRLSTNHGALISHSDTAQAGG